MKLKKRLALILLILLTLVGIWAWWSLSGGVSHLEIRRAVSDEAMLTRQHIDVRAEALERRADALDAKLDRLEKKLDRLLELATPRFPDGMKAAPVEIRH